MNILSVENALRTVYLSVMTEQLNNSHPLLATIRHATEHVWGKDIRKYIKNGESLSAPLCNLYGSITITDKALRGAKHGVGALVNLLNSELEGIIEKARIETGKTLLKGDKNFIGLEKIFNGETLYGLDRKEHEFLNPYVCENFGEMEFIKLEKEIDYLREKRNSEIDFIICSLGVKRAYQESLIKNKKNMDIITIKGDWKAISHNGIPVISDRNCPNGTMYLLNTKHFTVEQLCDWCWLEDGSGRILRQVPGKPEYEATLVKYANLICDNPYGQGMITGITEDIK